MRIGIDLDNTLFDTFGAMLPFWSQMGFGEPDFSRYNLGNSEWICKSFAMLEQSPLGYSKLKPYPKAVDVLMIAAINSNELIFVTGRPTNDASVYQQTRMCLEYHDLYKENEYGELWVAGYSKLELLPSLDLDLLIDDDPASIMKAWGHGIEVIVYDQPWNQMIGLTRGYGWGGKVGVGSLLSTKFRIV